MSVNIDARLPWWCH